MRKFTKDYHIFFIFTMLYIWAWNLLSFEFRDLTEFTFDIWFHNHFSYSNYFLSADRLVDWTALKRALEIVYSATLPKASKPFIYMSIVVPAEHVDVNVHPTKREVFILFVWKLSCDDFFYRLDIVVTRSHNSIYGEKSERKRKENKLTNWQSIILQ